MELIDGESLRGILSRTVGVLPDDEKLRITHDLCAGLAAIHDQRILHRDLKPENVMLDSSGRAVITDFGIASYAGAVADRRSGTPAYMAPEIHAGEPPTQHSDIYSLCLVLYELFAGHPPFEAESAEERLRLQEAGAPTLPDSDALDPAIRGAIVRGLAPAADDRFASAVELATALPPRPEIAAAAKGGRVVAPETLLVAPRLRLRRPVAQGLLAAILLALPIVAMISAAVQPGRGMAEGEPPVVLATRAREIIHQLGFEELPHSLYGYTLENPGTSLDDASYSGGLTPVSPFRFWYRQGPSRLVPVGFVGPVSSYDDPPAHEPGTVGVHLDAHGRLLRLDALPGQPVDRSHGFPEGEPDWRALLVAAELDSVSLRQDSPTWIPPPFADRRRAWVGHQEERGDKSIRIEAASFRGRPVAFRTFTETPIRLDAALVERPWRIASTAGRLVLSLWFFSALIAAVLLARRNLRLRTADRPAAFRIATIVLVARMLIWLLGPNHPVSTDYALLQAGLGRSLLAAVLVWVLYVALEPTVRSLWPRQAASWVRLLYGRFRDALLGRDLLVGILFGLAAVLWAQLYVAVPGWLGFQPPRAGSQSPLLWQIGKNSVEILCESLAAPARALAMWIFTVVHAVLYALFGVIGIALLRLVLTRAWLSRTTAFLLLTLITLPPDGHPAAAVLAAMISSALWLTVLIRFGFLATVTATVVAWLLGSLPMAHTPAAWTTGVSAGTLLVVLAVTAWGFVAALGGEPVLRRRFFSLEKT
jgi:serine/threonine-protein kinase